MPFFTQMSNIYGRGGTNLTNCNRAYIIFTYFLIIGVIACESSDIFFYVYFYLISFGFWYIELYNIYELSNQVVTNK